MDATSISALSKSQKAHRRWLKVTAIVVGSFAPIFFLGTMLPTSELARFTLDFLAWPPDGRETFLATDTRFLSALTGGFLLGWGVLIWCLSLWVYQKAPDEVRKTVVTSLVAWFILDSCGSIASGNPSNALFNVIILLFAVGPLWRKARES